MTRWLAHFKCKMKLILESVLKDKYFSTSTSTCPKIIFINFRGKYAKYGFSGEALSVHMIYYCLIFEKAI